MRALTKFIGFSLLAGMLVFSSSATSSRSLEGHSKDNPAHPQRSLSAEEIFRRLAPSVFVVEGLNSEGTVTSIGSGVAVEVSTSLEKDLEHLLGRRVGWWWYLVTNAHVVNEAASVRLRKGHDTWKVTDFGCAEPQRDLCALRIHGSPPPAVTVRQSSTLRVGERVYTLGAPEGLDLSLSEGVISGIRQTAQGRLIQTTAPISPGSSGGGLFDARGQLVGITTFFLKEGQNLNFALPGEWILDMAKRQAFGEPTRRAGRIEDQATGQTETAHESDTGHQSRRKEAERAIEEGDYKLALGMHHDIALYPRLAPLHVAVDRVFLLRHWLSDPVETDQKQVEEAARDFREATHLDPSLPNAHERLGTALSDLGDSDGAITELREALRLDPTMTAVHWSLSRALYKKGDLPAAIAEAREAVKSRPEDSVTHIHLGNLFDEAGDLKGEIAEYYQALQLLEPDPRDGAYAIRYILAATLEKTGDPEGAVAQYRDLIRLYPQEPYVSGVHLALGKALYSKRDLPGALVEYKEALRLEPEYPEAHFELGRVLEDEGELDGAITEYNNASNSVWHDGKPGYGLIGNDFSARVDYHRGVSYARQGWLDSAAHNLQNAVRELPDNAQMHHDFGQVLERRGDKRRGDPESALAQYRLARDLEPANPQYCSDYERLARKFKR